MMRTFVVCCSLLLMISCLNEDRVDPATPSTFVRYINGGNTDEAMAMEKTSDGGYLILANTKAPAKLDKDETVEKIVERNKEIIDKVKLVKVDAYGSVLWSKIVPDRDFRTRDSTVIGYRANGVYVLPPDADGKDGGYIISGEVIHQSGGRKLLLLQADGDGNYKNHKLFNFTFPDAGSGTTLDFAGLAATRLSPDNFLVLGSIKGYKDDMILAKISTSPRDSVIWRRTYPTASLNIINKMFLNSSQEVIFGATATTNNQTDLRLIRAVQDNQGATFSLPFGEPDQSERANGICKTPNGYAMIGSTTVAGKTDKDIQFTRFSESGALLTNRTYPVYYPSTENLETPPVDVRLNEEGNSVCTTADNGFIVLATIVSSTTTTADEVLTLGRGEEDYYLIKLNAFGDIEWKRAFGSKRQDIGVAVTQTDDGGYLILGTTKLANVPTITLIKTNSLGEIQ